MNPFKSADKKYSFAQGVNAGFLDNLYEEFKKDPANFESDWKYFFEGYEFALEALQLGAGKEQITRSEGQVTQGGGHDSSLVEAYINAYRRLGHLNADVNPLRKVEGTIPDLSIEANQLSQIDPKKSFEPANLVGMAAGTLSEIQGMLQDTYCRKVGADFRDIDDVERVLWLQEKMEACRNKPELDIALRKRIFERLARAEGFEKFLQARYLGQKRFSLEGAESLIPMLDVLNLESHKLGVEEIAIGMAHRGRLNVLVNIMGKSYESMLREFEGSEYNPFDIDGDVKYHMGYANKVKLMNGESILLYLASNPSHLEIVSPVVEGFVRARQALRYRSDPAKVLPVLLHGDAAFIGQGVTAENFNLSELKDYTTGGTIHLIINNQLGFTTEPHENRSGTYSSGVAKMISAPVFHVNADCPESCVWVMQLAAAYRQTFKKDVVIDLIGYRRHGHNETDEPSYTQPEMYKVIKKHPTVVDLYSERLVGENVFDDTEVKKINGAIRDELQECFVNLREKKASGIAHVNPSEFEESTKYVKATREMIDQIADTRVDSTTLKELAKKITDLPSGFTIHPKLKKIFKTRSEMLDDGNAVDWAFAELLSFASLAHEGYSVRLSGQDCRRGTFSSRHGVLMNYENGDVYETLGDCGNHGAKVDIINSPLSELGCLGFEYGFTIASPNCLVAWEAQFGDFANGGQMIIDQFIAGSEAKWKQNNGIVLLLPHGYEGMGPEHSSARLERFLQLCGNLNMQVVNCTTAAQHFHVLRRQMKRDFRKPLICMTPKSLLRKAEVASRLVDFTDGCFKEVIDDLKVKNKEKVERAILCSGKIYYELLATRDSHKELANIPIIRLEQIYPFPKKQLKKIGKTYPNLKKITWTQEEPKNMGAWNFIEPRLTANNGVEVSYVGRKHSGSTAEGSSKAHIAEQERIINETFELACKWEPKR